MHDFESRWRLWRREMLKIVVSKESLQELEAHLLDSMDRKMEAGMGQEQAFEASVRELGSPGELASHYSSRLAVADRIGLGFTLACWVLGGLGCSLMVASLPGLLSVHVATILMGYWTLVCAAGMSLWIFFRGWKSNLDRPAESAFRGLWIRMFEISALLFGSGILLGSLWSRDKWGNYWNHDPREYAGLVICLISLVCGISARFRAINILFVAAMSVTALLAGLWCYFLPKYLPGSLHTYGISSQDPWRAFLLALLGTLIPVAMMTWVLAKKQGAKIPLAPDSGG